MVINKKKVFVLGLDSVPPELLLTDGWINFSYKRLISRASTAI